jgi:Fe-S oxidoreductase
LPGPASAALAGAALSFEEFLVREVEAGRWSAAFRQLPYARALVHGHCHQKAFGAMPAVVAALKLVPGLTVDVVQSSCCGMAGSFGYRPENLDVSLRMAEASLLPAVRKAGDDTVVVADGTSCRHQIEDGAQRQAQHVARVLAAAL